MKYNIKNETTEALKSEVRNFEAVQSMYPASHPFWKIANAHVQPLLAELANRQQAQYSI